MANLREVARRAGVSVTAASAVLSGQAEKYRLPPSTQARVHEAAQALGYRYNALARGLRRGRSDSVFLLTRDMQTWVTIEKMRLIADRLTEHGYAVHFCSPPRQPGATAEALRQIQSLRPTGLVIDSVGTLEERDALRALMESGAATVSLEPVEGLKMDCVTVDRAHGAFLATRHLLRQGRRRIALMINPNHSIPVLRQREEGYRQAYVAQGVPVDETLIAAPVQRSLSRESGYLNASFLLQRSPRPEALFAANDHAAMGALRAAAELGVSIPEEVAVVGYDGLPETRYTIPSLTTLAQPNEDVAEAVTRLLLLRLAEPDVDLEPQILWLEPTLVLRESTEGGMHRLIDQAVHAE